MPEIPVGSASPAYSPVTAFSPHVLQYDSNSRSYFYEGTPVPDILDQIKVEPVDWDEVEKKKRRQALIDEASLVPVINCINSDGSYVSDAEGDALFWAQQFSIFDTPAPSTASSVPAPIPSTASSDQGDFPIYDPMDYYSDTTLEGSDSDFEP